MREAAAGFVVAVTALAGAPAALGRGANVAFDGGTRYERSQVQQALAFSTFDWTALPSRVTVHITSRVDSAAALGEVWLDSRLLDAGEFSWGVVQHEFGHEVDFLLLNDAARAQLETLLGAKAWCWSVAGLQHANYGCERFASTLAWAYWPSARNCMKPHSRTDESAAMAPAAFRRNLGEILQLEGVVRRR